MRRLLLLGVITVVLWMAVDAGRLLDGLALVVRAAEVSGSLSRLAEWRAIPIEEQAVVIPSRNGAMRGRVFRPARSRRQSVLLVSGVHPAGIDEPRLMRLARRLSEAGVVVVTPDLPELRRFEIAPVVVDRIEDAATWLAGSTDLAPSGRIGLMGVSFSGGLVVVASGRSTLRPHVRYVFSFGGHDDLQRVLDYYCTGLACREGPGAGPPHDYSLAVALLNVAGRMVPAEQVEPLRTAVRRFLVASYEERNHPTAAAREFAALRTVQATLAEPSATLLGFVNERNVTQLGARLQPYLTGYAAAAALSPAQSAAPAAPVFLLHGRTDTVIPATESEFMAIRLRNHVPVRLLTTGLISHAEADQPATVLDVMRLARFWADLLAQ